MPSALAQANPPADLAALASHACSGPAYSSYPTAERFSARFRPADALRVLRARGAAAAAPLAIDIHPPLREARPHEPAAGDRASLAHYLDCVERDIVTRFGAMGRDEVVSQVRCGAAAPSGLMVEDVARLMDRVRGYFTLVPDGDYAIEVEAHRASPRALGPLAALGFNKLVLVVAGEAPNPGAFAHAQAAMGHAAGAGFRRVEIDWLGALRPGGADAEALAATLALRPAAITIDTARDPWTFALATRTLEEAGYECVAMQRFATAGEGGVPRAGPEGLRGDLLAFGAGAVSAVGDTYSCNHPRVEDYCASLERGELPVASGCSLGPDDLARREAIGGLAVDFAIGLEAFAQRHGVGFWNRFEHERPRLEGLVGCGVLEADGAQLRVARAARPLARVACMAFDAGLRGSLA